MKRHSLLYLLLTLSQLAASQTLLQGHVVDGETGEALPYARVQSSMHVTLSNRVGDFGIYGAEDDTLTISYVGFRKMTVTGGQLPDTIRLKPMTTEMTEVVILPQPREDILNLICEKLHEDYEAYKNETALYFFRAYTEQNDSACEVLEGFYDAFCTINIADMLMVSGKTYTPGQEGTKEYEKTNMQKLFFLGPVIFDEKFWKQTLQPLSEEDIRKAYDIDITPIRDEEDNRIYKIRFLYNGWLPSGWPGRTLIQGMLYVDAATYGLLHFDGELMGMRQTFDGIRKAMKLTFRVDYSHERGFTEVSHISFDGGTSTLSYHCLLFKVDEGMQLTNPSATGNLVKDIQTVGYDQSLWEKYDIVRRTEEEERLTERAKMQAE